MIAMKNICFIANYYKTNVFLEVAKQLEKHNIISYWIIPNRKQYMMLKEIFANDRLLYIGKKEVLSSNVDSVNVDLTINELIYGDRVLRYESKDWTYKYLLKLKDLYFDFISKNNISHIFGEVTWAHELIAHRITLNMDELNCEFLNPHTIRIPNGRFTFYRDEFQSKIKEIGSSLPQAVGIIELQKPDYLALNDKHISNKGTIKSSLRLIKNFIFRTNQDSNDPTLYGNPITQLKIKGSEFFNRFIFKNFISEVEIEDLPKDKKKILFTLHKQPEASIDVIGRYYENQLELISNIWRLLPENYILIVKEHSNAIGDRGIGFYKAVKNKRNLYLVNNKTDSHALLDMSEAVFTVSGTIAYEAALKEKIAFTFAPTFFNDLNGCKEISWKEFKYSSLDEMINNEKKENNIASFSEWLYANSFQGIMSDSFGDPRSMEENNIKNLTDAFFKVIYDDFKKG